MRPPSFSASASVEPLLTFDHQDAPGHVYRVRYVLSYFDLQTYSWRHALHDRIPHDLATPLAQYGETLDWRTLQWEETSAPDRLEIHVDFAITGYPMSDKTPSAPLPPLDPSLRDYKFPPGMPPRLRDYQVPHKVFLVDNLPEQPEYLPWDGWPLGDPNAPEPPPPPEGAQDTRTCPGCGQEIDPTICYCGNSPKDHDPFEMGHTFVPLGCDCLRDKGP